MSRAQDVSEEDVRLSIHRRLEEAGMREHLKDMLRQKLMECGWRDNLKTYCKEIIRSKGLEKITVDQLVEEVTPRGRATVPESVKSEMFETILKFLQNEETSN